MARSDNGASRRLALIGILLCTPILQGCEWFEGKELEDTSPLANASAEIFSVQIPRVALDGNGFATILNYEQTSRGSTHTSQLKASRYNFATNTSGDHADIQMSDRASPSGDEELLLASDQSGTAVAYLGDNRNTCRFAPTLGWTCAPSLAATRNGSWS